MSKTEIKIIVFCILCIYTLIMRFRILIILQSIKDYI